MQKSPHLSLTLGAVLVFWISFGTTSLLTQATQQNNPIQEQTLQQKQPTNTDVQEPIKAEQNEGKNQFPTFDLVSDTSLQRFLSDEVPFTDPKYIPEDLAPIESDFTSNNAKKFQLRKEAGTAFADMARHFWNSFQGKKKLTITSAYRSFGHQEYLQQHYCHKGQCAEPGSSEHQAGLALDLGQNGKRLDQASIERLQKNAHRWGFHQTYQKGPEIDGKMTEPWHWRYLGIELATVLFEQKLSFREWRISNQRVTLY